MAKSIRSKVKKRNRTEMRRTVGDPYAKKLQAKCTSKIQKAIAFKEGAGITKLKSILTSAQESNPPVRDSSKHGFVHRNPDLPEGVAARDTTGEDAVPTEEIGVWGGGGGVAASTAFKGCPRSRSRSISDLDAYAADEDTAMDEEERGLTTAVAGAGVVGGGSKGKLFNNDAGEVKKKNQRKNGRRKALVEFT